MSIERDKKLSFILRHCLKNLRELPQSSTKHCFFTLYRYRNDSLEVLKFYLRTLPYKIYTITIESIKIETETTKPKFKPWQMQKELFRSITTTV